MGKLDDALKALTATLDEIDRVLGETENSIAGARTQREDLIRAREEVLRAIDELQRLRGK
jgi:ABC-type transporter Mla subunit MlaD